MNLKRARVEYIDSIHGEQVATFGARDSQHVEEQLKDIANDPVISLIEWLD